MADRKLFHGTMNASKSAQLLMQVYNLERQAKSFVIFKPAIDTRDNGVVKSRALDEEREAILVSSDSESGFMFDIVGNLSPDFVFVDELQFMTKEQVFELADISIYLNTPVFAYGLLVSYTGELFEGSKRAIECGFTLHELKMQCDFCNKKSTNHLLYVDGSPTFIGNGIHIGDTEYKSVCYDCYRKINKCNK